MKLITIAVNPQDEKLLNHTSVKWGETINFKTGLIDVTSKTGWCDIIKTNHQSSLINTYKMSIFKYCVLVQIILVVVCHGKPQKSEGDYDTSILKPCELAIWR